MQAQSDGPHWRTKLTTMRDPGVGNASLAGSGREHPGYLPGTPQVLNLRNCEAGGVGNAAADLSSSTNKCQVNSYSGLSLNFFSVQPPCSLCLCVVV
jgi:hypothetical protein